MGAKELTAGHTSWLSIPYVAFAQHQRNHPDVGQLTAWCCPCSDMALPEVMKNKCFIKQKNRTWESLIIPKGSRSPKWTSCMYFYRPIFKPICSITWAMFFAGSSDMTFDPFWIIGFSEYNQQNWLFPDYVCLELGVKISRWNDYERGWLKSN